jgi:NADH dehydrogenase [ubiquinone] 1 alpha subcomplex assembly factor 5
MSSAQNLFDLRLVRLRKDKAKQTLSAAIFLAQEIETVLWQRVGQLNRSLSSVLVLGCPTGYLAEQVTHLIPNVIYSDENRETLPFQDNAFDLVIDGFGLHWVNDLPKAFVEVQRVLRPQGAFLAGFLGEHTLHELRQVLIKTDLSFFSGAYARVSPFLKLQTLSELLMAIGFQNPVVDHEEIEAHYSSLFSLIDDLRNMGETNCLNRPSIPFRRDYFIQADQIYAELYAAPREKIRATFDTVYLLAENRKGDIRSSS